MLIRYNRMGRIPPATGMDHAGIATCKWWLNNNWLPRMSADARSGPGRFIQKIWSGRLSLVAQFCISKISGPVQTGNKAVLPWMRLPLFVKFWSGCGKAGLIYRDKRLVNCIRKLLTAISIWRWNRKMWQGNAQLHGLVKGSISDQGRDHAP